MYKKLPSVNTIFYDCVLKRPACALDGEIVIILCRIKTIMSFVVTDCQCKL
jgi:hypothetical protein